MTTKTAATELAERTEDAYSYDRYGRREWGAICTMLLERGYDEREAEAILRSKWTRWAGDMAKASDSPDRPTAGDMAEFLDTVVKNNPRAYDVAELVAGTFPA